MTATTSHLLPNGQDLDTARAEAARAYELDREHVFHSWSAQAQIKPMTIVASEGSYIWDGEGTRLLDFSGQLVFTNIGHQHPKVVAAIAEQAAKLCTVAPQHANAARSEAARLIAERTPGDLNRVFFTNGGADAVEHAVRMARLHTGRRKVLSRYRSYHGGTDTAINLTGDPRRYPNDYGSAGVVHFNGPFLYRSSFYSENEQQESERALDYLERLIAARGPGNDRRDHPGIGARHRRHHGSAARIPGRRAGDLRQIRHRVHRRRGDGRIRADRKVVRHRPFRRRARPHDVRQGSHLRLRAAGRRGHQRRHLLRRSPTAPTRAG